jgi:hypothetical protein
MTSRQLSSLIILFICLIKLQGQNNRWINYNQIGWYNYFGTFKLNPKFSLHTEYQFRRNNFITDWQQSLLRVGINYELNSAIQLRVGYGNIETFNYGDIPINKFGKNFTEHRSYVAITLKQTLNKIDVSQRYKLEQRWVGQYSDSSSKQEDKYTYLNRMRYMLRIQIPLTKTDSLKKNQLYFAVYDELFIGFGKNVVQAVFDQNRLSALIGFKFKKHMKLEAGYLYQILQLNRLVLNRPVFQDNQGFITNLIFNL